VPERGLNTAAERPDRGALVRDGVALDRHIGMPCATRSPTSCAPPGVDVVVISKLLGHSSIAVTSRYLDHLTNDRAVAALAAVELPEL
jgi:integrase